MSDPATAPDAAYGAGGYVLDTAYLYELYPDHSPVHLNAVAAFNGARPRPLAAGATWCDVGCGNGISALAIAAALPQVRVIGVDLNPGHITFARGIARAAGLDNARFLEGDYAALPPDVIPPLDFAVLHGVLSWVDPTTRDRLLDRVMADLLPGGLLMASYDALPGWAAQRVMRDMMVAVTQGVEGGSLARARAALAWLRRLRAGGAAFFRDNPVLGRLVDELRDDQVPYIAHEYLNAGLWPFAFAQVNEAVAARGGSFVGRTEMFLNVADLAVPEARQGEVTGAASRAEFEARRDFVRNEGFRRDVYVKGAGLDDLTAWDAAMDGQRFAVLEPLAGLDRAVAFGGVTVTFAGPPWDDALAHWDARPGAPLSGMPPETTRELGRLLAAARLVEPVAPASDAAPAPDAAEAARLAEGRLSLPLAFNRVSCLRLGAVAPRVPLAAPALGAITDLGAVDALLMMGLAEVGRADAPRWTVRAMAAAGRAMQVEGRPATDTEAADLLRDRLEALFASGQVAKLVQLGVLVPAG